MGNGVSLGRDGKWEVARRALGLLNGWVFDPFD